MNKVTQKHRKLTLLAAALLLCGAATAQVQVGGSVYGGGNLASVSGNTEVLMNQRDALVSNDVYGGGALADVGTSNSNTTAVTILEGTVRDVYGGGLGDATHPAAVNGVVTVNIGKLSGSLQNGFAPSESVEGEATINGSVYGCNNANGTPKDNVTVNIYKTAREEGVNTVADEGFAIANVFGGGNQAHYEPSTTGKQTTVHIWTCDNTIQYVYGGGNAANVGTNGQQQQEEGRPEDGGIASATDVIIDGGRIEWVFGGGNGYSETGNHDNPAAANYNPGANIYGTATSTFHGGKVSYFFGGSNQWGIITGAKTISVPNDGLCEDNYITELYGGNNEAPATGDITLTMPPMPCLTGNYPCRIEKLFGGSRNADITGNVTLTIEGGDYGYVFGGNNEGGIITGNVTLNLYGGSIDYAAFGGNNEGGSINGKITVNMLQQGTCPLVVHNIYGGGNEAAYAPTYTPSEGETLHTEVNLIHGTVSKKSDNSGGNVYGGGLGSTATVTANTIVNVGYDASMATLVGTLLPAETTLTTATVNVAGNVFGGGEAAAVTGSTFVNIQQVTTGPTASTNVGGDVYGGGALANTGGSNVTLDGGTIGGDLYGGGLGQLATVAQGTEGQEGYVPAQEDIAAQVTGPVQVTVNAGKVTGAVYGCNNANGAPTSTVKVDIYGTDAPAQGQTYALSKVFGGGNMAAFDGTPDVTIHGCDNKIGEVYGGGNKASVAGTNVVVYGGNTIGKVFAGGNGQGVAADYVMVSGNAVAHIYGGIIDQVFGGNNASGTITGNASALYINKEAEPQNGTEAEQQDRTACTMKIREVYGGGNLAAGNASTIYVDCTGTLVALGANQHYGTDLEGIGTVYGGANAADVSNDITLNIYSGIVENVFGGNNASGAISGSIQVNINKDNEATCADHWYVGNVYGGGNEAAYSGTPVVNIQNGTVSGKVFGGGNNITTANAGVGGSDVEMTGGNVLGGIYGGCNVNGYVTGDSEVNILGGTLGAPASGTQGEEGYVPATHADVYGGGLGQNTRVSGDVTVTISRADGNDAPAAPTIYGDVYGGSAFGDVNASSSNTTTVNILDGTLVADKTSEVLGNGQTVYFYTGGNVFGGGLGRKGQAAVADNPDTPEDESQAAVEAIAAKVNGVVIVNIGEPAGATTGSDALSEHSGNATIGGNVYGGNNTNGSPQNNVTVNVYGTAHTADDSASYVNPTNIPAELKYAIANVFGGGNEANYAPLTGTANVNIFGCYNTVERVFGGGNAAATPGVHTDVQGGRFFQIFGGGNGERGSDYAANINGDLYLAIHGGNVGQFYGISNQNGNVIGLANVVTDNNGPCGEMLIDEFFCGGNFADITGNLTTTITCSEGMVVRSLYGGCNQAVIRGNVTLNVEGGTFTYVYGGSKGVAGVGGISADILDNPDTSEKEGNVTLNLYGGTIENVFGGSNVKGNIEGRIIVNIIDEEGNCPLYITNIYGGSNVANYTPTFPVAEGEARISPIINIVHAKNGISGNVYGGSKGMDGSNAVTTLNANPLVNVGHNADMNSYLPSTYPAFIQNTLNNKPRAIIAGSVFGGGDAAKVVGDTKIMLRNRAKVFGNVYGGGNMGEVTGDTKVIVNGDNQ